MKMNKKHLTKYKIISLPIIILIILIIGDLIKTSKQALPTTQNQHSTQVSYPQINKENYPNITFLDTPTIINQADYSNEGWITAISNDQNFEIEHPLNRRVSENPTYGLGFCQPESCQDRYPIIQTIRDKTIEQIFAEMTNCEIARCYGINVAVSDFKLGNYRGFIWWMHRLSEQEVFDQKLNNTYIIPDTTNPGLIVFQYNNDIYKLMFDLSDYTQKKMLSTFRLSDIPLKPIKNTHDEIKVFTQEYVNSLIENDQDKFISLLTNNTASQINLADIPFDKIISHDLLDIVGPDSKGAYIVKARIWSEGGFPLIQEGSGKTQYINVIKENQSWKTTTWQYSVQN